MAGSVICLGCNQEGFAPCFGLYLSVTNVKALSVGVITDRPCCSADLLGRKPATQHRWQNSFCDCWRGHAERGGGGCFMEPGVEAYHAT